MSRIGFVSLKGSLPVKLILQTNQNVGPLAVLPGRLGRFASTCSFGSRGSADGLPGLRRSGLGEANARLITVGKHDPGCVERPADRWLIGRN